MWAVMLVVGVGNDNIATITIVAISSGVSLAVPTLFSVATVGVGLGAGTQAGAT